jgi:KaiC/GvpD/RAD55 family RecA-like ATPase
MRFDVFNVSRKTGFLSKIDELLPPELELVSSPAIVNTQDGSVDLKNQEIGPFELKTIKLRVKASKSSSFILNPQLTYLDESGEAQTCKIKTLHVTIRPAPPKFETLPGRITTGFEDLDAVLLGGLPEKHAIALVGPSIEERELIVSKFLSAGVKSGDVTFFVTADPRLTQELCEKYPSNFFLFVCCPQAGSPASSLPNVIALKGIENLNAIDIELVKAIRTLNAADANPRRICLGLISDALLQHHAVTTRRWLSALLPTLKSKGFTILSVIDSQMHPVEELQAILALFDGELRIIEKETENASERILTIRKLHNQKYIEKDLQLTKENLQK